MSLIGFLLKRSRGVVALSVILAGIGGAGGVALIALIHAELDRPDGSAPMLAWGFAGLFVIVAATRFASQAAMARLGQGAVADLRSVIGRKVLAMPLARFEASDRSAILAVLTEDVGIVAGALVGIPQVGINLPILILCMIYVGWLSPPVLACGVVFAVPALMAYFMTVTPAMRHLRAARAGHNLLLGHIRTLIDGFRELKQHRGRSDAFLDRALAPAAATVRDRAIAGQTLFGVAEGWGQLAFFGFLGFLLFVVPTVVRLDRATLVGVVLVVLYVMGPLDVILMWVPMLGRARASVERIEALIPKLDTEAEDAPTAAPLRVSRSIRLDGVGYAYHGEEEEAFALGPVDLTLHPGEIVILAGGNGSGKTTLVKVLAGLYVPDSGAIEVDGRAIGDRDRAAYRALFSVLYADGHLFRDLPGLERPGLEDEARAGLERLGLGGRVEFAGHSYSTLDLSQGQRRRLALLTALLEDRPVCIFDEWAANQDPHFRRAFYREILPELREMGKAILVISHDEDYYEVADRLVRLRGGRIVADAATYTGQLT